MEESTITAMNNRKAEKVKYCLDNWTLRNKNTRPETSSKTNDTTTP